MNVSLTRTLPVLFLTALVLSLPACEAVQSALAGLDKPTARLTDARLQNFTLDSAQLLLDVEVLNPYPVALPLQQAKVSLASQGQHVLTTGLAAATTVPAGGRATLQLPVGLKFGELMGALQGVQAGSILPYELTLEMSPQAPGYGPVPMSLKHAGTLPIPAVPQVRLKSVNWQELSLSQAVASLVIEVGNPNAFALDLDAMNYALSLGQTKVADVTASNLPAAAAKGTQELTIPVTFRPRDLGMGVFSMLTGRSTGYDMQGTMALGTQWGQLTLPLRASGTAPLVGR